jgi:hypothetical protein
MYELYGHMGNPVEGDSSVIAMMPMAPGDVAVEGFTGKYFDEMS